MIQLSYLKARSLGWVRQSGELSWCMKSQVLKLFLEIIDTDFHQAKTRTTI